MREVDFFRGFIDHGHFKSVFVSFGRRALYKNIMKCPNQNVNFMDFSLLNYSLQLNKSYLRTLGRSDGQFVNSLILIQFIEKIVISREHFLDIVENLDTSPDLGKQNWFPVEKYLIVTYTYL